MNTLDRQIAEKIWPQHMLREQAVAADRHNVERQQALSWLGDRYLLAKPVNRRK